MGTFTISTLDLRGRIGDVINRVTYRGERVILEKRGKPVAAIISVEDLRYLERIEAEAARDPRQRVLEDDDALARLYAESAAEDLELAEMGLDDYRERLEQTDHAP